MPAKRFKDFFSELDEAWKGEQKNKIPLQLLGAGALHFQTNTPRETQDADILETREISKSVSDQLKKLAGRGTKLARRHGIYLQLLRESIPFLPQDARFYPVDELRTLKNFKVGVLDPVEVAVSKLKRFNERDNADIVFLIKNNLIRHKDMVDCLNKVFDYFSTDARAEEFPIIVKRFNELERDLFQVDPTEFDLPSWI